MSHKNGGSNKKSHNDIIQLNNMPGSTPNPVGGSDVTDGVPRVRLASFESESFLNILFSIYRI